MSDPAIYQQYLESLKDTVEGLLVTQVANVWSIYGGLNRLYLCLEKIFRHGCKNTSQEGYFYNFIQGLEWLQPAPIKSYFSLDCEYRPYVPSVLKDDKSAIWLFRVLESHSLCVKLSWLLSDEAHLHSCYEPWAFLCQKDYTDATLICLRAVEKNQATYLSEIDPRLFVKHAATSQFSKSHRRCSSFPIKYSTRTKSGAKWDVVDSPREKKMVLGKLKPWSSLPALQIDSSIKCSKKVHFTNKTTPNTPLHSKKISPNMLKVDYSKYKVPTKKCLKKVKAKPVLINNSDIIEYAPPLSSSHSSGAAQDEFMNSSCASSSVQGEKKKGFFSQSPLFMVEYSFLPMQGEKDYSRRRPKSFIEDGGMSILPMSTGQGYLPKPIKGQTLTSYLTSSKMARSNAELDRENAHFSVSEAIISAMEKLKCQYREHVGYFDSKMHSDSDESEAKLLNDLKQRIRLRKRQKLTNSRYLKEDGVLSDGKTDTITTASPSSTPSDSFTDWSSTDEEDIQDVEIEEANNLRENLEGLSMSMASLYSEADIFKNPRGVPDGASEIVAAKSPDDVLSPEGVALSLISKFNEKHLPKASDLEWLVSEKDAPQALLPLPQSWPVNPDDCEPNSTMLLRGTRNWAPPRPQIVLSLLPVPVRKEQMEKQNYKCAGCGMTVATQYASKFRYCHYLGKYFCTGCHKNQVALIPARILHKWDFNRYPVSTFSFKLLEQMYSDPLFRIFEINKNIGKFTKNLEFIRKYRRGLSYLKEYIFSCRFAETAQERLEQDLPAYFLSKPDEYSIDDLVNIKNGDLKTRLKFLVDICLRHTSECSLCLARGYICEHCRANEVIFPWQMKLVTRCLKCGTCYHTECWKKCEQINKCSKCFRKSERNKNVNTTV
ncbi:run domain Beclin-1-interacting and cysteine-rich domain-containing protein [Anthonomus grandis grandis]|uniref:run domain Beclin-1-interacting and cysteine-rich domain-containing protein n=1 Tax=Anthonomus grandis grandis TaxID=2921223 RepID=UPI0021653855|nr:run domain Beclin-1-interacting and cysteine-rich domain-containing protein [Anthonomus grandis grandis]